MFQIENKYPFISAKIGSYNKLIKGGNMRLLKILLFCTPLLFITSSVFSAEVDLGVGHADGAFDEATIEPYKQQFIQLITQKLQEDAHFYKRAQEKRFQNHDPRRRTKQQLTSKELEVEARVGEAKTYPGRDEMGRDPNCFDDNLFTELKENMIQENGACQLPTMITECGKASREAKTTFENNKKVFDQIMSKTSTNAVQEMKQFFLTLGDNIKTANESSITCENAMNANYKNPECLNTYDRIFSQDRAELFAMACRPEYVDGAVEKYVSIFRVWSERMAQSKADYDEIRISTTGMAELYYQTVERLNIVDPEWFVASQDPGS